MQLVDVPSDPKESRREREREIEKNGGDVPFPGWDALQEERRAADTRYYVEILDAGDTPIRRIAVPAEAGTHRVAWDMRGAPPDAALRTRPAGPLNVMVR